MRTQRVSFYLWTAIVLAVGVVVVILGWHAQGGTTNPTDLPPGRSLSHTTVVINSAILVFREGLETILVLAAVTASFLGAAGSLITIGAVVGCFPAIRTT